MTEPDVRKGMPAVKLSRALPPTACYFAWGCFRYFLVGSQSDAAWLRTQKAGAGFADPNTISRPIGSWRTRRSWKPSGHEIMITAPGSDGGRQTTTGARD
jgi:hypothetical protein